MRPITALLVIALLGCGGDDDDDDDDITGAITLSGVASARGGTPVVLNNGDVLVVGSDIDPRQALLLDRQ